MKLSILCYDINLQIFAVNHSKETGNSRIRKPYDEGRIEWRLHLSSPPEDVFKFVSTDEGREKFWVEKSNQSGNKVSLSFINGIREISTVLVAESPHVFRMEYFGTTVEFRLASDGNKGTDLHLLNWGVDDDDYLEVHAGWLNVLLPLKAAVDFGIDLRTHDNNRTWHDGYVDQ